MAFSWQESVKPAGTQDIQCDIEYLDKSYIHVYLDGVETSAFTWTSSTNIRLNSPLSAETAVLLIRKTEREYLYIEFASGAPFIEVNVDTQNTQLLHLAQELVEGRYIEGFYGDINMHRYRITNLGDPVDAMDAAHKQYVDAGDARLDQRIDAERVDWMAADAALDVRTTNLEQTHFNANTNSFPWWTVLTADTDTVTPGMPFTKAKVRVNGVTQTAGYSYTVTSGVVKFAEVLPAGTLVDMTIGIDTEADTSAVATILGLLGGPKGTTFIGEVNSFAELRTLVPDFAGQIVSLRSHQAGWVAQARAPVGGGEFVAVAGSAVDDGGYICVPEGQSSFYWMRILGPNEYLTPQMYGYITGYSDSTETGMELKPYIQAAIDTSIAIGKSKVLLPDGDYYSAIGNFELAGTGHNRSAGVLVFGENPAHTKMGTRIYFDAPELTSPLFVSRSPSSVHTGQHIDDLWLGTPMSKRYRGVALSLVGTCHMLSQRVHVERLYDGINLLNTRSLATDNSEGDENGYCELNTFRDWTINKCVNAISFNNDGTGDPSLHGTSFQNCFIQLKEDGNGLYFKGANGGLLWYNSTNNTIKFWGGADDTTTCQLIRLEGTEVRGVSGQMTWEGRGRISCDQYSWWRFNGDIFGIPSSLAMIDYSGVVSESYLGDARVAFNNTTSKDRVAMSNPVMSGFYMRPIMPFSRAAKRTTNIPVAMPIRITSSPLEFPTDTSNYEGIAFPTFHNGDVWFGEVVNQSVWSAMVPSMKITSSNGAISNYYGSGMTLYNFTANGVALSNPGWTFGNNIYPLATNAGGIGTDSNRLSSVYANSAQITASGIFPKSAAAYSNGSAGAPWDNIYSQNAVTVISDSNLKPVQEDLSAAELRASAACSKLFIKYKLAAAVAEKGDSARYHFGVVAQKVMAAFADNGLSADDYGVLVTANTKQVVVKNGDNYEPVINASGEIHIPANEDGFIDLIDSMDSISTDEDGNIILTRTTHLIRYEELLCFVNAGLVARLEALENKLGG